MPVNSLAFNPQLKIHSFIFFPTSILKHVHFASKFLLLLSFHIPHAVAISKIFHTSGLTTVNGPHKLTYNELPEGWWEGKKTQNKGKEKHWIIQANKQCTGIWSAISSPDQHIKHMFWRGNIICFGLGYLELKSYGLGLPKHNFKF